LEVGKKISGRKIVALPAMLPFFCRSFFAFSCLASVFRKRQLTVIGVFTGPSIA